MQSASEARRAIRAGEWTGPTVGLAPRYAQANLVALPREYAYDFLLFCQRNPRPCPLLEVLDVGATEPACAPGADLRTDLPRYRVWRDGVLADEPTDVRAVWRDDLVAFLRARLLGIVLDRRMRVEQGQRQAETESALEHSAPLVATVRHGLRLRARS